MISNLHLIPLLDLDSSGDFLWSGTGWKSDHFWSEEIGFQPYHILYFLVNSEGWRIDTEYFWASV